MSNKCKDCGGRLTAIFEDLPDLLVCDPCWSAVEKDYARRSVMSHLFAMFWYIFHFHGTGALGALGFAFERLFKVGDYHPKTGRFYKKGYLPEK